MRNAQEPIMIGNAARGFMPSSATRIMHGAYRPMPSVISAPSTKLPAMPTHSERRLQAERVAAGREELEVGHREEGRRGRAARCPCRAGRAGAATRPRARAEPRPGDRGGDHGGERRHLDLDDRDEDEGLHDRRNRVADVQRAGICSSRHESLEFEDGGRRRERADAERVEEVRHEADRESQRARPRGLGAAAGRARPGGDEHQGHQAEGHEENRLGVEHVAANPSKEPSTPIR